MLTKSMQYNWRGPPYHMIIHVLQTGTPFIQEIFVWCTITAYTITYSEYLLYKWSTVWQACIMVRRAASVVFYFILLGVYLANSLRSCIVVNTFHISINAIPGLKQLKYLFYKIHFHIFSRKNAISIDTFCKL